MCLQCDLVRAAPGLSPTVGSMMCLSRGGKSHVLLRVGLGDHWALEPPKHLLLGRPEREGTLVPLPPHTLTQSRGMSVTPVSLRVRVFL